jgi:hypothetical protein
VAQQLIIEMGRLFWDKEFHEKRQEQSDSHKQTLTKLTKFFNVCFSLISSFFLLLVLFPFARIYMIGVFFLADSCRECVPKVKPTTGLATN